MKHNRTTRFLALIAAPLFLAGCLTINTGGKSSPDPYLEARLARLEALLIEQADATPAPPEERLERIEAQLEKEKVIVQEIVEAPVLPANPAPDAPLVAREESVTFSPWSAGKIKMGNELEVKFTETSTKGITSNRLDLVGKPLRQRRYLGPSGEIVDLSDFQDSRNVVLVFMRGFSGQVCIGCSAQAAALAKQSAEFEQRNAQVVLVYPGSAASVPVFVDAISNYSKDGQTLPFPLLLDVNLNAVNSFDIKGSLAKPTTLIIDKEGIVRYAYAGKGYDDRPSIKTMLEELDGIVAPTP